ncbi:hypothetical protein NXW13_19225 [Bacteroides thetaiotaomicron]|nr:hypothetical protein [Bacteroides thetaiotaomicron]
MYYISNADYGLIGYKNNEKVFSAGSKNFIAGWQFDKSAIWLGTKNNNVGQYTSTSGSITIGTNGFRGYSWFINADGSASFANGNFFGIQKETLLSMEKSLRLVVLLEI